MKNRLTQLVSLPAPIRILAFLLLLALLWLPLAALVALWSRDPNQTSIMAMTLLFVEFIGLMRWWGQRIYQDRHIFQTYGLVRSWRNLRQALRGFGWGTISVLPLILVQLMMGWLAWQPPSSAFPRIALEGLLVAVGVGLAEELVFRGWVLNELQRDYSLKAALWIDSLFYSVLHFIKPWPEVVRTLPQFPGLVLIGLILVWMKRSTRQHKALQKTLPTASGQLGLPIGFHAGLVWGYYLLKVGGLVSLTNRVPEWLTGIDGNPLAGVMGLLFLSSLAVYWRWRASCS